MSEPARLAAALDRALRARGVDAGTRRALTFAEVLTALPPRDASALYWSARVAMLPAIEDLERFDDAFVATFGASHDDAAPRRCVEPPPVPAARDPSRRVPPPPAEEPAPPEDAGRPPLALVAASAEERLRERDFDAVDDAERAAMRRLIARVRVAAERRRSRRRVPDRHGDRLELRATLRAAARSAGELLRPRTSRRRRRVRPLVFLIDVSGSMEPFARALLHYARVCTAARPRVRVFAFATRLTDLTPMVRRASDAALMASIAARVRDFGGGTRIGEALRAFNAGWGRRGAARGGTAVIVSDGWEREHPELVGAETAQLRRLVRRVVWVNPHKRHPAYEPLARGMAAALPHVDAFLSGHNVRSLEDVAAAIAGELR